ncbi:AGE family epimerase/isomerase [Lacibacter sp. H375]|uniref:AGE family epimerase/isomerase n=1 Tax=Lacibacter sp. H375 TaxID=3133424 RepID=UPI0030C1DEC1
MELMSETEITAPLKLQQYKTELQEELSRVLDYWMKHTVDHEHGGFYGSVNNNNEPDTTATKGIVMMSRICWSFSAAYRFNNKQEYYAMAERAFNYIFQHFIDREHGAVYWSVDAKGNMLDGKKQIYGLAFCIYGLTEFYKISRNPTALNTAIDLYNYIEEKSFDTAQNGYVEAFTRDWQEIADLRLSAKDNNERKTANTHLHIVEAYANLYTVWPKEKLKERITNLLQLFQQHFISKEHHHLNLFFDDSWNLRSTLQSYGHDIEAAWLLQDCASIIQHSTLLHQLRQLSIPVTNAAAEGLDKDGGMWYEYEPSNNQLIEEKHSWPQAEAMIGFYNAYQLTGDQHYLENSLRSWEFIKTYIRDDEKGEWFWGVHQDHSPMNKEKAGFWKCPYHSSRALLELVHRINNTI